MAPYPVFVVAGAVVGVLAGLFGVGGSAIATPILAVLGVPGLLAVASPLPATIPAALAAAVPYLRAGEAKPRVAGWSLLGAVPATVVGALLSEAIGGPTLLLASGLVLVLVGAWVVHPLDQISEAHEVRWQHNRGLLVIVMAGVGLFSGLLANGGGFLLIPIYLLVFGLQMREAVGTSLLVIAVLTVPTLITHSALGHVDWTVAGAFAFGMVPAAAISARLSHRISQSALRTAFGWLLIICGTAFVAYRFMH